MKKLLFPACLCTALLFSSCSENSFIDDLLGNVTDITDKFTGGLLQGQGLTLHSGFLPEGTADVFELDMNGTIVSGGSLMFNVNSDVELKKLYIQVKGASGNYEEDGYYELDAKDVLEPGTSWVYNVAIQVSQDMDNNGEDLIVKVSALTASNTETSSREKTVETLEVGSGALQISLSWNNYDDLDLWVLPPGGDLNDEDDWISYYNTEIGNGYLDLDARGCSGHKQNENIYFEAPLKDGDYIVEVELFASCSSDGASYSISTFSDGSSFKNSGNNYQGKFDNNSGIFRERQRIGTIKVSGGNVVR